MDTATKSTSRGENNSNTDERTSSERDNVRREVTRPIPLAADQRTTVSCKNMTITSLQSFEGKIRLSFKRIYHVVPEQPVQIEKTTRKSCIKESRIINLK